MLRFINISIDKASHNSIRKVQFSKFKYFIFSAHHQTTTTKVLPSFPTPNQAANRLIASNSSSNSPINTSSSKDQQSSSSSQQMIPVGARGNPMGPMSPPHLKPSAAGMSSPMGAGPPGARPPDWGFSVERGQQQGSSPLQRPNNLRGAPGGTFFFFLKLMQRYLKLAFVGLSGSYVLRIK